MVSVQEWFSPTRTVGLAAYAASCVVCAARWRSGWKRGVPGRWFALMAGVQFFLLLDMAFDWRWEIHGLFDQTAMNQGVYGLRAMPQIMALCLLVAAVVVGSWWVHRVFRGRPGLALALIGTAVSVGLWCSECISYHYADRVFYSMVGAVMLVGLVWIGVAVVTCLGVLRDWRRNPEE